MGWSYDPELSDKENFFRERFTRGYQVDDWIADRQGDEGLTDEEVQEILDNLEQAYNDHRQSEQDRERDYDPFNYYMLER